MKSKLILLLPLIILACTDPENGTLFDQHFEPYIDLISGQQQTEDNGDLLDGMAAYRKGDHESALSLLQQYSKRHPDMASPYMYMGVCHLALGKPYDAELMFDHLDNIVPNNFIDQSEWYSALCLLRSEQYDRCRQALELILAEGSHTYRKEAKVLLADLDEHAL